MPIYPFEGVAPIIHESAYAHPDTLLIGSVNVGADASMQLALAYGADVFVTSRTQESLDIAMSTRCIRRSTHKARELVQVPQSDDGGGCRSHDKFHRR